MTTSLQSDVLARLRDEGGPAMVAALAALLARTAPARLSLIEHGLAADDRSAVVRATHSLRSSAANLGARDLASAAGALELLAESPESWQNRSACQLAAATIVQRWSEVAHSVRQLASAHVETP